jgi:hypothetical protein
MYGGETVGLYKNFSIKVVTKTHQRKRENGAWSGPMRMKTGCALFHFVCFHYNVPNIANKVVAMKMLQLLPGVILILKHLSF